MKKNDYDKIATQYVDTDAKPDKRFSILPTVLSLVGGPPSGGPLALAVREKTNLESSCCIRRKKTNQNESQNSSC